MGRKISKYEGRNVNVFRELTKDTKRTVSFVIMAHPKRREWAEELVVQIPATIVWDTKNDRHDTGQRSIEAFDPSFTHHCVIQDDVILAPNFKETVKELISYPNEYAPIGLYYGAKGSKSSQHVNAHNLATSKNASWLIRKGPVWGPGIIYPTCTIPDLLKFYRNSAVENYDRRVMRFYQHIKQDCWYTIPSLVEHRNEDNPSLCGHDKPNRQAKLFAGPQSALEVNWSGPAVRSNA